MRCFKRHPNYTQILGRGHGECISALSSLNLTWCTGLWGPISHTEPDAWLPLLGVTASSHPAFRGLRRGPSGLRSSASPLLPAPLPPESARCQVSTQRPKTAFQVSSAAQTPGLRLGLLASAGLHETEDLCTGRRWRLTDVLSPDPGPCLREGGTGRAPACGYSSQQREGYSRAFPSRHRDWLMKGQQVPGGRPGGPGRRWRRRTLNKLLIATPHSAVPQAQESEDAALSTDKDRDLLPKKTWKARSCRRSH